MALSIRVNLESRKSLSFLPRSNQPNVPRVAHTCWRALYKVNSAVMISTSCALQQEKGFDNGMLNAWDLTYLTDEVIDADLADAATYRMLVRRLPSDHVNIKDMLSFRDNVTRKLAPAVARARALSPEYAGCSPLGAIGNPSHLSVQSSAAVAFRSAGQRGGGGSLANRVTGSADVVRLPPDFGSRGVLAPSRHGLRRAGRYSLVGAGRQGGE